MIRSTHLLTDSGTNHSNIQTCNVKLSFLYSDNQKTMEYKDDNIALLKCFDVVTKQIFLQVT